MCGYRVNLDGLISGLLHATLGRQLIQSAGQYPRFNSYITSKRAAYKGVTDADTIRGA